MKLNEIYTLWKEDKKRQVKQATFSVYALTFRTHLLPFFKNVEIEQIDKKMVKDFVNQKISTHSVKTIKGMLILLKMLIKYAGEELEIKIPSINWKIAWPSKNIGMNNDGVERYSQKEVKRIFEYLQENPSYSSMALLIAFTTGVRIGELCALKYEDIDFEQNVIRINKTLGRTYLYEDETDPRDAKTKIIISQPKTCHSHRSIPLTPVVKKLLKKYAAISSPDYYVITGARVYKEPRVLRVQSIKLLRDAGVEKVLKFHAIRHTFATTMIEKGVDPKTLSTILGHSDVSITLNLYVHPSDTAKANAVARGFKGLL